MVVLLSEMTHIGVKANEAILIHVLSVRTHLVRRKVHTLG